MNTEFTEDLHDVVGCTVGCARPSPSPIATVSARTIAGTNDNGDTPVTTSAVIDADGTAAEVAKSVSTVPLAIEENVGCAIEFSSMAGSISTEPSISQMVNSKTRYNYH
jgi:hypothetical protein